MSISKDISVIFLIFLLALLQSKVILWSGHAPDLLLMGLIALAGFIPIINLVSLALFGFLVLAGPIFSVELITMLVIISFSHFLRLFILGHSSLLTPFLVSLGVLFFYLETVGLVLLSMPLFMLEILLVGLLVGLIARSLLVYF